MSFYDLEVGNTCILPKIKAFLTILTADLTLVTVPLKLGVTTSLVNMAWSNTV